MKTYRNLYSQVCDFENLYRAYRRARKGKRGRAKVAEFEFFLEDNLAQLQDELVAKTYRHGDYRNFTIRNEGVAYAMPKMQARVARRVRVLSQVRSWHRGR